MVAADPDGRPRLLIDVTVAKPLRTLAESSVDRGHAARIAEGLKHFKRAKYADHSPDGTLIPPSSQLQSRRLDVLEPLSRIFFGCVLVVQPRRESETTRV
jgi:hypothetical protein